jgi:hypothetical protein
MSTPLIVLYDAQGGINEDGSRGPLWSSDCRPASTLKGLCAELLMAGWPLETMLKLPDDDEPVRFYELYRKEFDGRLPKNFEKFQRAAKIRDHIATHGDPYGLGLPADGGKGYGTSGPSGGPFGSWLK